MLVYNTLRKILKTLNIPNTWDTLTPPPPSFPPENNDTHNQANLKREQL